MTERPKLLFLCQTLPFPLDGGVWIRTYHVLRQLSREFEVTALCFERMGVSAQRDRRDVDGSLAELRRFGEVDAYPVPQTGHRGRQIWDHLCSVLTGRVYTHFLYDSRSFAARLDELLRSRSFDLVHVDSLDLSRFLPRLATAGLPVVCVHHNVESELLRRRARFAGRAPIRSYFRYQADRMERVEREWLPRVALNVVVSDEEREVYRRWAPSARYAVVPNGVDVEQFFPGPCSGDGVAYIGGTNWFPNLDALEFFCADILPHLRAAGASFPIAWVGSASEAERARYRDEYGVELTGYVDDVRPHMRDTLCNIVPLRAGGGTRLKILNSWAMGKAVVSTRVGCEGLEARDGENILVRDEPAAFAGAILSLRRDPGLLAKLEAGGRRTAEERYSWEVIGRDMIEAYRALLPTSSRDRNG